MRRTVFFLRQNLRRQWIKYDLMNTIWLFVQRLQNIHGGWGVDCDHHTFWRIFRILNHLDLTRMWQLLIPISQEHFLWIWNANHLSRLTLCYLVFIFEFINLVKLLGTQETSQPFLTYAGLLLFINQASHLKPWHSLIFVSFLPLGFSIHYHIAKLSRSLSRLQGTSSYVPTSASMLSTAPKGLQRAILKVSISVRLLEGTIKSVSASGQTRTIMIIISKKARRAAQGWQQGRGIKETVKVDQYSIF